MKAVIFAGGFGTRISEETHLRPKPMVEIGGKPVIWHIMKIYSHYGIREFVICLGYKGYVIKEYFANYFLHMSDVTFDFSNNRMTVHHNECEPWLVTLVDTGLNTMTGGRLKMVQSYLGDGDFCLTYGDGVADINLSELIQFHKERHGLATITAVQPPGRFGALDLEDGLVRRFMEKPQGDGAWINGGFFVLSPKVLDCIEGPDTIWEREPLQKLAEAGLLHAYAHYGFWYAMDTLRDRNYLEELWESGQAPWRVWQD